MKEPAPHPVSVRLDRETLSRATAFARRRKMGLTTALRIIVSERLIADEAEVALDETLRWQRIAAWSAYDRIEEPVSLADLELTHAKALKRAMAKKKKKK